MKRMSVNDCVVQDGTARSEYVVIDIDRNGGNRAGSFNIAYEGGFLEHIGDGFYKCKRIVASNLSLIIMSDYPLNMK